MMLRVILFAIVSCMGDIDTMEIAAPGREPSEFKCEGKVGDKDACSMSCGPFTCSCRDGWFAWSCVCGDMTLGGAAELVEVSGWGGVCMSLPDASPKTDRFRGALEEDSDGNVCKVFDHHLVGACGIDCDFGSLGKVRAICSPTGLGDSACLVGDQTIIVDGNPCRA